MASLMINKSRGLAIISVFALGLVSIGPAMAQGWSTEAKSGTFGTGQGADPFTPSDPPPTGAQGWSSDAQTFGTSQGQTFGTSQGNNLGTPTVPSGRPGGGAPTIRGKK
jgi:hypothetical protein